MPTTSLQMLKEIILGSDFFAKEVFEQFVVGSADLHAKIIWRKFSLRSREKLCQDF